MTLSKYENITLDNYFDVLENEGRISTYAEYNVIILDMINELLNGKLKNCITKEQYNNIILPAVSKIIDSNCIFISVNCKK